MPSKHPAGGCGCCSDCDCTFELVDCVFSWECPTALNVKLLRLCSGTWYLIAEGAPTGSATVAKNVEYKLEVYCESLETPSQTYDLGVLTTSDSCPSDCIPISQPVDCECADTPTSKKTNRVCTFTVSGGSPNCTSCSTTVSGYDWSGSYDVDCNETVTLWKSTLIKAACASKGGQDVYVIEKLEMFFFMDALPSATGTRANAVITAFEYVDPGTGDPCPGGPFPTGSAGICDDPGAGLELNRCTFNGQDTSSITFLGCSNANPCNSTGATRLQCVDTLTMAKTCQQLPPFFLTLCNYSSMSISVVIA